MSSFIVSLFFIENPLDSDQIVVLFGENTIFIEFGFLFDDLWRLNELGQVIDFCLRADELKLRPQHFVEYVFFFFFWRFFQRLLHLFQHVTCSSVLELQTPLQPVFHFLLIIMLWHYKLVAQITVLHILKPQAPHLLRQLRRVRVHAKPERGVFLGRLYRYAFRIMLPRHILLYREPRQLLYRLCWIREDAVLVPFGTGWQVLRFLYLKSGDTLLQLGYLLGYLADLHLCNGLLQVQAFLYVSRYRYLTTPLAMIVHYFAALALHFGLHDAASEWPARVAECLRSDVIIKDINFQIG